MEGFRLLAGYFDPPAQARLLVEVMERLQVAPGYHARMPRTGKPMSVRMSNFGPLGWWSDVTGYRYVDRHPETGASWPDMPEALCALWEAVGGYPAPPEACLVNYYGPDARLGLHIDADEGEKDAPVISVSLGDRAIFRLGGRRRSDPTRSIRLASGDVCVLGGPSRHAYHGVDRIIPGSSTLIPGGGRISLTLRRVTPPRAEIQTPGLAPP